MPVTAWVAPEDLPAGLPTPPGGDGALAAACELATATLFALSGRRWAGHADRTIVVQPSVAAAPLLGVDWVAVPVLCAGQVLNHTGCERPPAIRLPDYPVRAVTSVTVAGQLRDPASYRLVGSRYLEDGWSGWQVCGCEQPMEVAYTYGADPPAAARAAATRLASELVRAFAGQPSGLPGYITQRVRQGETISYTPAGQVFDKGRTGLPEVDLWLAAVNPAGLRRRSRAWSPDTDPRYTTTAGGGTP